MNFSFKITNRNNLHQRIPKATRTPHICARTAPIDGAEQIESILTDFLTVYKRKL